MKVDFYQCRKFLVLFVAAIFSWQFSSAQGKIDFENTSYQLNSYIGTSGIFTSSAGHSYKFTFVGGNATGSRIDNGPTFKIGTAFNISSAFNNNGLFVLSDTYFDKLIITDADGVSPFSLISFNNSEVFEGYSGLVANSYRGTTQVGGYIVIDRDGYLSALQSNNMPSGFTNVTSIEFTSMDQGLNYFLDNFEFGSVPTPSITSATYNANTGKLVVNGSNFVAKTGAANDVAVSKLSLLGEGGATYTLTSTDVEITSAISFTVALNAVDKAAVNMILNKNGGYVHKRHCV